MSTAENDARPFGKCSECPEHVRLTANGKVGRHKRLPGAREFGTDKVWCEGSGVAPARVIPPAQPDEVTPPTYGMCTACGAVEVALVKATGVRDLSNIGESATYPTGYGCEACS